MSRGPAQVATIAPHRPFATDIAKRLIEEAAGDPLALSDMLLLVPLNRARKPMEEAFLEVLGGNTALMPRIHALGEFGDDEASLMPLLGDVVLDGPAVHAPTVSDAERRLTLLPLISRFAEQRDQPVGAAQAWRLAGDLGRLIDESYALDAGDGPTALLARLDAAVDDRHAAHWHDVQAFLSIALEVWPTLLAEMGKVDRAQKRDGLLRAYADRLAETQPDRRIVAAGSTGTVAATRALLAVIARLPSGTVVLPGFDRDMDQTTWDALQPHHPDWAMKNLITAIGIDRAEVERWDTEQSTARTRFLRDALRPAETTGAWADTDYRSDPAAHHMSGLSLLTAPNQRVEAAAIAAKMRETLEVEGRTAMLVTPDRMLAAQVQRHLARWSLAVDDSAGTPASDSTAGRFLMLVAEVAETGFSPVPLLALLQHPMCHLGHTRGALLAHVRRLDALALRGPRPVRGGDGFLARLRETKRLSDADRAVGESLINAVQPLVDALESETSLSATLTAHIRAAEAVASGPSGAGDTVLWAKDEGRAIAEALSEILSAPPTPSARTTGADYPALMREWLGGLAVRRAWESHPRLRILSPLEARLQRADLVILGELNEGVWPAPLEVDPWMSRSMRRASGLVDPMMRIGQSAQDFSLLASQPEVMITRSEKLGSSPSVKSRWLFRMEALSGKDLPAAEAPLAWVEALATSHEIRPCAPPAPTPPLEARPKRLSVTHVETWMRDPYSLYASKILKLRALDPVDDSPNAAQKGTYIHDALEAFLRGEGPRFGAAGFERLLACGKDAFAPIVTQPAVYAFWWPRFEAVAHWFVTHDGARAGQFDPALLEETGRAEVPGHDFILEAKADRIDLRADTGAAVIIDYKTGTVPTKKTAQAGYAPQLPLEGWLVQKGGFDRLGPRDVDDMVFWRLSGGEDAGTEERRFGKDMNAVIADAHARLDVLLQAFSNPDSPYLPHPRPREVKYHDYDHLARIGEWTDTEGGS